jgi:hypothetical protein
MVCCVGSRATWTPVPVSLPGKSDGKQGEVLAQRGVVAAFELGAVEAQPGEAEGEVGPGLGCEG